MLKSLNRVLSTDPGFNTRNLLTGIVALPGNKYPDGPKQLAFQQQLLERINSLPEWSRPGQLRPCRCPPEATPRALMWKGIPKTAVVREYEANTPTVSQNYFSLMGIPLRAGRFFSSQDRDQIDSRGRRKPGHGRYGFSQPECHRQAHQLYLHKRGRTMSRLWEWWQRKR